MRKEYQAKEELNQALGALTQTPKNQVDYLEKQLVEANEKISELNEELLGLYRRVYASDRPQRY